ncbi:RagB/SusD family nutrient uptake outer membrane protein [Aureibaculum algae]|uniref:RagB/SusD family nutrient uptake outer membrane protein n=1 Tax=Aureibaculum algae TaxID=2584122 RepID=A0A5B7TTS2_9FLAO|nr:RagB/SusD family nutrient uptake outer membrane protein [Aureibaculum algae]QCX38603.1 RagB/SusD family nutrient uptake outer membrane protein [Aureibaculum algae]
MKKLYKHIFILSLLVVGLSACNDDFLDRAPLSDVTPDFYLKSEADLAAYAISNYSFPSHGGWSAGTFTYDNGTDNQASTGASNLWVPGQYRVGTSGGSWYFGTIRNLNYFLDVVLPRYEAGEISGNEANVRHYIGEIYFLRAYEYFNRLQSVGDFPIITTILPDVKEELIEVSKRRPRNEVARFILSDLDKALEMLTNIDGNKNRINPMVAQLFKSRVALYEGTWLTYHKGTAHVPGGPGWPGANKDYLSGFNIDIDSEIDFFLTEAMNAAEVVASNAPLTPSNGNTEGRDVFDNPYYAMFGDLDMSGYSEVLMWRDYDEDLVSHHTMHYLNNGANTGYTKGYVDSYLMKNGLPIYASGSGYNGDDYIEDVLDDRDDRLRLFTKEPGDVITYINGETFEEIPGLFEISENRAVTGYSIKKGIYPDADMLTGANPTVTGAIVFRASEAYLNYIEADYVKNGSLDGNSVSYWGQLRERAGMPADYSITVAATDLSQENDWAKYSQGSLVDPTLYNIRRERRSEFIAEGMRLDDLKRWRSLDQVSDYVIEGFKVWGPMKEWYKDDDGNSQLKAEPDASPNVSPQSNSMYIRPYQIVQANNNFYNGYNWNPAHYLSPIAFNHFLITSESGDAGNSVIYQNPGWLVEAGSSAQ